MPHVNASFKEIHEQFVSGHDGTTVFEIAVLATIAPVTVLIRNALNRTVLVEFQHSSIPFIVDFVVLILPLILSCTILADNNTAMLVALAVIAGVSLLQQIGLSKNALFRSLDINMSGKRSCLTNYRSFINIATAVFILAVDFEIFPRRFCKTEIYGTGLMDVGVASYMFANALVSPEVRGRFPSRCISTRVINSIKSTAPLWVLGFCRLVSVKATDYHEHLTEYGIHWNFFFTLAVIRVLSTILYCFIDVNYSWLTSLIIIVIYEMVLCLLGLRDYILSESTGRVGLLAANREGVFSCFGYLALYCAGVQLGCFIFKPRQRVRDWLVVLSVLAAVCVMFWLLHYLSKLWIDDVSRRLCNLSYFIFMIFCNVLSLASFLVSDIVQVIGNIQGVSVVQTQPDISKHDKNSSNKQRSECSGSSSTSSDLLEAVNFNGLLFFLVANLLTGAVNFAIVTVHASTTVAMAILIVYMLILSTIICVLYCKRLSVKFW